MKWGKVLAGANFRSHIRALIANPKPGPTAGVRLMQAIGMGRSIISYLDIYKSLIIVIYTYGHI